MCGKIGEELTHVDIFYSVMKSFHNRHIEIVEYKMSSSIISLVNVGNNSDYAVDGGPSVEMIGNSYVSGFKVGFTQWDQSRIMNGIVAVYHSDLCSMRDPNHEEFKIDSMEYGGQHEEIKLKRAEAFIDVRGYIGDSFYRALEFKIFDFFNMRARTIVVGDPAGSQQTDWAVGAPLKIEGPDVISGVQVMSNLNVAPKKVENFPHTMSVNYTVGFAPESVFNLFKGMDYHDNAKKSCMNAGLYKENPRPEPEPVILPEIDLNPRKIVDDNLILGRFTIGQLFLVLLIVFLVFMAKKPDVEEENESGVGNPTGKVQIVD